MNKKHKEYLIISIDNIKTKDESDERVNLILGSDIVIKDHQKIVLKLSLKDKNHLGDAYELVTKEPFYFKNSLFEILFKGTPWDNIDIESNNLAIRIHPKFVTIDEVKSLINEIIASGEAKNYQYLIKNILLSKEKKYVKRRKHTYI